MLYTESFVFNPFQENTYIIRNDARECIITDPGMYGAEETTHLTEYLTANDLKPVAIVNTHAHIDHILGVNTLKQKYGIPFYLHEKELPVLQGATASAMMFGFDFKDIPTVDGYLKEGNTFKLGTDELAIRFTPGHSPGSVVLYYAPGNWVIGGDVLFNGSIGRTDLPGGDHETLLNSITREMYTLPDNTTVYSGHGAATTIGNEKKYNPFVRG